MKFASSVFAIALILPFAAQGAEPALPGVVWTSTVVRSGLDISSDEGHVEYEALEQGADKPLQPEPVSIRGRKPMIAVIIDDMGMDRAYTARALSLPPQVAVSYLPYSPEVKAQTDVAKSVGHELVLHIPMEPERKSANPGPNFLGAEMTPLELHARILKNLEAFDGYAMVNNHMGSKFSKDRDGLGVLMSELAERKLMFLDSRTVPGSLAEKVAKEHGIVATHRDVFIDNSVSPKSVSESLAETERVARATGTAIALGHPKAVTLAALEKWLPSLRAKGFDLVPLSQVIALRSSPKKIAAPLVAVAAPKPAPVPVVVAVAKPVAPAVALEKLPEVVVAEPVMPPENIPAPPVVAAKPVQVASVSVRTGIYGDERTAGTIPVTVYEPEKIVSTPPHIFEDDRTAGNMPVKSIQKRKTMAAIADRYFLGKNDAIPAEKPVEQQAVEEIAEPPVQEKVEEQIIVEAPVETPAEKPAEAKPYVDPLAKVEAAAKEWEARKPQQ